MTKHDLKELATIGAELGAAKAENERLRGLLTQALEFTEANTCGGPDVAQLIAEMRAALSQQAEPCEFHGRDRAACEQHSGTAPCETAPAQDEHSPGRLLPTADIEAIARNVHGECSRLPGSTFQNAAHNAILYALERIARPAQTEQQHPDDAAVDRFAAAMKAKLAAARAKGRGGWDDPNVCSVEFLAQLLVEHLGKGNTGTFEDVANFAMMLHQRGADPKVLAEAAAPHPEQSGLYTCIGKGGSYELIGRATTAGALKVTGRFADDVIVYRDTESSELYCREPGDFRLRMARTALSAQGAGDASA